MFKTGMDFAKEIIHARPVEVCRDSPYNVRYVTFLMEMGNRERTKTRSNTFGNRLNAFAFFIFPFSSGRSYICNIRNTRCSFDLYLTVKWVFSRSFWILFILYSWILSICLSIHLFVCFLICLRLHFVPGNCNFDRNLCGFTTYNWTRKSGRGGEDHRARFANLGHICAPFTHATFNASFDAISPTKRALPYHARMLFREASRGFESKLSHISWGYSSIQFMPTWRCFVAVWCDRGIWIQLNFLSGSANSPITSVRFMINMNQSEPKKS